MTVLGDSAFGEVIKVKANGTADLIHEETPRMHLHRVKAAWEHSEKAATYIPRERPQESSLPHLSSNVQSPELRETKLVCLKSSSSGHPRRLMPLAEISCKDKAAVPNLRSVYTPACLNNSQCPGTYSNCITTPGHGWNEHSHQRWYKETKRLR